MQTEIPSPFLSPRGWAEFAWQADYGQFYLIDCEDDFRAPEEITAEMEERSLFVPAAGIVVYTAGCMQQRIRLSIYGAEPRRHDATEYLSGRPWTRVETVEARFPSKKFSISSPSHPDPLPNGPLFLVDAEAVRARISWMEFQGGRDDSVPVEPDVIEIKIWPGAA